MAMISPRDLYLRQHPTLARIVASGDRAALTRFLTNHGGIATGWQRVMGATQPTLQDPQSPGAAPAAAGAPAPGPAGAAPAASTGRSAAERESAFAILSRTFEGYGLGSLAGVIRNMVQQDLSEDSITLALQETAEYKQRFAANEARRKAGLRVLSPAEYIATENAYRQVMQAAGMPSGFYDDQSDFEKYLAEDKSPAEIQERVNAYVSVARNTDSAYRKMIADTFGVGLTDGDIAAYMMDPGRALPAIEKSVNAFGVADAARRQGLSYSKDRANQLAEMGVSADQAGQAYGQVAEMTSAFGRAGDAYGLEYDQDEAEDESLLGLDSAKRKRQRVQSTFEAYNPGSTSRTTRGALGRDTSGSY